MSTTVIGDIGNPGTRLSLEFSSVQHQDAGNYMCVAVNVAGRDTKIMNLQVLCKYQINSVMRLDFLLSQLQQIYTCVSVFRALDKREYLMIFFLISHRNHML